MVDNRRHRGPHPQDLELFGNAHWPILNAAVFHLSWLLTRHYSEPSALKLVGDRFNLKKRQRIAIGRSACADQILDKRLSHQIDAKEVQGQTLHLDGYNILITLEAALSGAIVLRARDGCYRDMASMHGHYRKVEETLLALSLIGERLKHLNVKNTHWLLDRPVSNSGRLRTLILEVSEAHHWNWSVDLIQDPDSFLISAKEIAVTSDSVILDNTKRWFNLVEAILTHSIPDICCVPLDGLKDVKTFDI